MSGEKLKAERERLGLGLREAAEAAGVFHSTLAAVESGRKPARLEWLWGVCTALGIDPNRVDERLAKRPRKGQKKIPR